MSRSAVSPAVPPPAILAGKQPESWKWIGAVLFNVLLLVLCTTGQGVLRRLTGDERPFTILYLIPVALSATLLGVRGGIGAALIALILARVFLFPHNHLFDVSAGVELLALAAGTLIIGIVTGRLRETLGLLRVFNQDLSESKTRLEEANARLTESEQHRRAFNREVLLAVTGGKLQLVEPAEIPPPDLAARPPDLSRDLREPGDASLLRRELRQIAGAMAMADERIADLCTGVTEAATNAVKHGHGGFARAWVEAEDIVVQVTDHGEGISPANLARATLELGYSTKVSLGMGFSLILQTADMLALCTDSGGTTLMLWISKGERPSESDTLLARYVAL